MTKAKPLKYNIRQLIYQTAGLTEMEPSEIREELRQLLSIQASRLHQIEMTAQDSNHEISRQQEELLMVYFTQKLGRKVSIFKP